jgi:hypothetical protein
MGIGAAIATGAGYYADSSSFLDPLLWRQDEAVQAGLHSNSVEFDGIKSRVIELPPDTEELDGIAIAKPVADQVVAALWVLVSGDVCQGNEVLLFLRQHNDGGAMDFNGASLCVAHDFGLQKLWRFDTS